MPEILFVHINKSFGHLPRVPLDPEMLALDPGTPMGHPMGVWFEILMVCWPCIHFQCWKLRKLIPNMSCIIRFFGDLPRAPLDPGTPMGHPVGVWLKNLMVCWPCICFQCWKLRKLIPNMPCIIRFFRDPFWTPRDPRGAWGPPRGVPQYYQDPKVSLVTYSNDSGIILSFYMAHTY